MILKNETHMSTIKNTLSSMVMAAPLAVAAPSTLPPDASAQPFEMRDSAKAVSIVRQLHGDWQLREPDRVKTSGNLTLTSAKWYGAHHYNTDRNGSIANLGVTPTIRRLDDGRVAWYLEDGENGNQPSAAYNAGWHRGATADGYGDHTGARYTTSSGVDIGLLVQHHSTAGHKHPDKPASLATMNRHNGTWTWTQTV